MRVIITRRRPSDLDSEHDTRFIDVNMYAYVLWGAGSMIKLKEGDTYVVAQVTGEIGGPGAGIFQRDTCWLSLWRWKLGPSLSLAIEARQNKLFQYLALTDAHKAQIIGFERNLCVTNNGVIDTLSLTNTSMEAQAVTVELELAADFRDVFMIWGQKDLDANTPIEEKPTERGYLFTRKARDGVISTLNVQMEPKMAERRFTLTLQPGQSERIIASVEIQHRGLPTDDLGEPIPLPERLAFIESNQFTCRNPAWQKPYDQAIEDLRLLLLPTPFGPYPAAGLPNFVNFFGRDALITSMMIGPENAEISKSVLKCLAHYQGTGIDPFREEEPGKILHEIRRGELSRSGTIPFGRYYGSVDSTPLFIMALGQYVRETGDLALADELYEHWTQALAWLVTCQTKQGLVRFKPSGSGLTVQSWKDSHDSMNHADGTTAEAPLAVAEVQGYAFAAFIAASELFAANGDLTNAKLNRERAGLLRENFHDLFWLSELNTYAMALDKNDVPLAVKSSDPGHLLWCGIVPEDIAPKLVATLLGPECWSGWGLRTLGTKEARYNPVSYHNGSVWPHDTALFGAGLARYGFQEEVQIVAEALFALAAELPGHALPELVCGFPRVENHPPISYTHACSPQAWAAAGLVLLARLASPSP